ncbi:MAG: class I SAM-dependent methyltransferase [Actinomycetota bacterium]|nr:class I SAM-dependent methyltransferase [Actinomycetota bacterium]
MEAYRSDSYGEAFAEVYDEWYRDLDDVGSVVAFVTGELASSSEGTGRGNPALLELGVGTGRLALPFAAAGWRVTGIDSSRPMLDRLSAKDPSTTVTAVLGDMVDDMPSGSFDVVLAGYNTIFNVLTAERQRELFRRVAGVLAPAGCFVLEAFVPDDPPRTGGDLTVRSIAADAVVLHASVHEPDHQRAHGQFIEITEAGGVRLRPWSIRYAGPAELDEMAAAAGMALSTRVASTDRAAFDDESSHHIAVYRLSAQ